MIETRILNTGFPILERGSTLKVFAPPRSRGQIEMSDNLRDWTGGYPFVADGNCEALISVTDGMIGTRYFRAVHTQDSAKKSELRP